MRSLRGAISDRLHQAFSTLYGDNNCPKEWQPKSFFPIDNPHPELGDVSWPGLLSLKDLEKRSLVGELLLKELQKFPHPSFHCRGISAGFVNFSWSEAGRNHILLSSTNSYKPFPFADSSFHCASIRRAIQRIEGLKKMARDQYGPSVLKSEQNNFAKYLTSTEELALIASLERLEWTVLKANSQNHTALINRALLDMSERYHRYYEANILLKGDLEQVRSRIVLSQALMSSWSALEFK